jgi:hypothetical protein
MSEEHQIVGLACGEPLAEGHASGLSAPFRCQVPPAPVGLATSRRAWAWS